jgi:predicted transcriptional regulator
MFFYKTFIVCFVVLLFDNKLKVYYHMTFYTNYLLILFIVDPPLYSKRKEFIMKNRCRNEIITSMLEIISKGGSTTTRTKIMYGAYLSYTQLNEYLPFLLENDLISRRQQRNKRIPSFIITEKGTHFLKIHNQINEMIATTIQTNRVDRNE